MRYTAYIYAWTFIVYISSLQTASACTIQTGSPQNGGGSCDFTDVKACGYTFDGYWTTLSRPYSYLGANIPGSRSSGSTEKFYGLYDFGHRKNDKKTLTSPRISAGRYCLGFWYYKSGSTSILSVSLASRNIVAQLWNATKSNVSTWIHHTIELDISSGNDSRIVFSTDDPPGFFDANTVGVDDIILSKELTTTLTTTPTTKTTTTPTTNTPTIQTTKTTTKPTTKTTTIQTTKIPTTQATKTSTTQTTKSPTTTATKPKLTIITNRTVKPTTNWKTTLKTKLPRTLTTIQKLTQKIQASTTPTIKLTSPLTTKPKIMLKTTTRSAMPTTKRTTKLATMLTTTPITELSPTPTKTGSPQFTTVPTTKPKLSIASKPAITPIVFLTTFPTANFTMAKTAQHTLIPTANLTAMQTVNLTKTATTAATPNNNKGTRSITSTAPSAIPIQSTSQGPGINLDSAVHVACEHDRWNISVDMNQLKQLYPDVQKDNIYLGSSTCKGVIESDVLKFQQSLQTCSTTEMKTNTSFNFRNKVVYAESDPQFPFIIRRHVWDLMVECVVLRETVVHMHVLHENLKLPGTAVTPPPDHSAISLAFYRDRNFLQSISGPPLHIKVGDTVYAKAFILTQDMDVKLVLHSCYMTPQANATDTLKYFIIKNGCVTDPNTHIISYSQYEVRFVFQEIEYSTNPAGLEIYCQASLCDVTDYSTRCSAVCVSEPLIG